MSTIGEQQESVYSSMRTFTRFDKIDKKEASSKHEEELTAVRPAGPITKPGKSSTPRAVAAEVDLPPEDLESEISEIRVNVIDSWRHLICKTKKLGLDEIMLYYQLKF